MSPALTSTPEDETLCSSCHIKLDSGGLKCAKCQTFVHLRCSQLPLYQLVRFAKRNAQFWCVRCCKADIGDAEYDEETGALEELIDRERAIVLRSKEDDESSTVNTEEQIGQRQANAAAETLNQDGAGNTDRNQTTSNQARPTAVTDNQNANTVTFHNLLNQTQQAGNTGNQNASIPNNSPICKFYAMRQCNHGRLGNGCRFRHPKICPAFSRNGDRRGGCSKGGGCKDFHPKVCFQSMEAKECNRRNCRFYHLNGTRLTYNDDAFPEYPQSHRRSENQGGVSSTVPTRILQRNNPDRQAWISRRGSEHPLEERPGNNERNENLNPNFFIMEQKIQRIEVMLGAILQSVRPPSLATRLTDP